MENEQRPAAAQGGEAPPKNKHEEKFRKKDQRSWENVSKAAAGLEIPAKLAFIQEKYEEVYTEMRRLGLVNSQLSRQMVVVQKEKDHSQAELTKSVMGRSRLESLCRELQKQNKKIKEENMARLKEEEERRKAVSVKFADKLTDINNMMEDNKEKSEKLKEENTKMTTKLAEMYMTFQKREEDITRMARQMDLEKQFSQAIIAKLEIELKAEKEINLKEQALLKANLEKSEANCSNLMITVKGLQEHIDLYKTQYDDFESTMSKSSKIFDNLKLELSTMSKKTANAEKEMNAWKSKFHESMKTLVEMSEIKKQQDTLLKSSDKKIDQLNRLCRQLQVDRTNYLKMLKEHGIEPPAPPPEAKTKMTKKEKELQGLKENLEVMQNELSKIQLDEASNEQNGGEDTPSDPLEAPQENC